MDIIILAAIAIYIFIKLRQQLGKVDEDQKRDAIRNFIKEQTKTQNNDQSKNQNKNGVVVNIVDGKVVDNIPEIDKESQKILESLDSKVKEDLNLVLEKVKISVATFLDGANKAFEMIIDAFAKADTQSLKPLLSDKILQQFKLAIKDRQDKGQFLNSKISAIDESKIIAASKLKNYVTVTVKFISRQINYITDKEGKVIEGSKEEVNIVSDIWTFKKDSKSSDPNWFVCATAS